MSRHPGERAINHGGIGWVEPATGAGIPTPARPDLALRPRIVLRRQTPESRNTVPSFEDRAVAQWRPDGWPLCPFCGDDELAALCASQPARHRVNYCYNCGSLTLVEHTPAAVASLR